LVFSTIKTLDLLRIDTISSFLNDINPSVIINCAAYTSVDKAETESKLADIINSRLLILSLDGQVTIIKS
jgi:dTDP-4-dehydrorhamnose reductase